MIKNKNNIAESFYAFHDGDIILEKEEKRSQIWKIDCEYLAETINPSYKFFWIKLYECSFLEFTPWMNPIELPKEKWTKTKDIFKTELEISSAKVNKGKIEISCNQHNSDFNFCGGELLLDCEGIEIFDQEWKQINEEELGKICNDYWNKEK